MPHKYYTDNMDKLCLFDFKTSSITDCFFLIAREYGLAHKTVVFVLDEFHLFTQVYSIWLVIYLQSLIKILWRIWPNMFNHICITGKAVVALYLIWCNGNFHITGYYYCWFELSGGITSLPRSYFVFYMIMIHELFHNSLLECLLLLSWLWLYQKILLFLRKK